MRTDCYCKIYQFLYYFLHAGHVDAGKSTLMGHVLYQLGFVNKRTMHKYEQESKKLGKASFAYAWVLDETEEERSALSSLSCSFPFELYFSSPLLCVSVLCISASFRACLRFCELLFQGAWSDNGCCSD